MPDLRIPALCLLASVVGCAEMASGELGEPINVSLDPVDEPPACVPDCRGLHCGLDPVCHQSCGECTTAGTVCIPDGTCAPCRPGEACDDNDPCTFDDTCDDHGSCGGAELVCDDDPGVCGARRACNGTATCSETFAGGAVACNDGELCTHHDVCDGAGGCAGVAISCVDDGTTCGANRTCDGTAACAEVFPDGTVSCNDGNAGTNNDRCNGAGVCIGDRPPPDAVPDPNLSTVTWGHGSPAGFPVNATMTNVTIDSAHRNICWDMTKPAYTEEGTVGHMVNGNAWVFGYINGRWYAATFEWLRSDWTRQCSRLEWVGTQAPFIQAESYPINSWYPAAGDKVAFMISSMCRGGCRGGLQGRSELVITTWP
ncbi:MAG: hypothetical protein HY903_12745 [Deltaproteobacteria bacterium]|nr:hypothetical protein [Deltaproteobacteria bacterium]